MTERGWPTIGRGSRLRRLLAGGAVALLIGLCGCAGLIDTRSERLSRQQVGDLLAQRKRPEDVGFGPMKIDKQTISFATLCTVEGDEVTTVPMIQALGRGESHVVIDVLFNDTVHVPMIVDTGASTDVISPSLVEKLKIPLFDTGQQVISVHGIGGEQPALPCGLMKMQLGGMTVHKNIALVLTEQYRAYTLGMFGGQSVDGGILGMNSLGRFRWVSFDWKHRTVTFARKGDYTPDPKKLVDSITFWSVVGKLLVSTRVSSVAGSESVEMVLDTGSDDAVMLPVPVAKSLELIGKSWQAGQQRWIVGLGGYYAGAPFVVPSLQIGRLKFIKTSGHTVPGKLVALFGNKLMRDYKTTFDFAHGQLILEKP